MNTLLFIAGIALVVIAVVNLSKANTATEPPEPEPKEGDIQIRQQGAAFWTYRWISTPGWKLDACYPSLEDARAAQKKAQERRKDEVVIQ